MWLPGQTGWRYPLPTILPRHRGARSKPSLMHKTFSVAFNTFLVVSALLLAFVVLEREERYALGQTDRTAAEQTVEQSPALPPME